MVGEDEALPPLGGADGDEEPPGPPPVGDRPRPRQAVIEYFRSPTMPGARTPWSVDKDNPMSPHFVALTDRTENGKARWWALRSKRRTHAKSGDFDEGPSSF